MVYPHLVGYKIQFSTRLKRTRTFLITVYLENNEKFKPSQFYNTKLHICHIELVECSSNIGNNLLEYRMLHFKYVVSSMNLNFVDPSVPNIMKLNCSINLKLNRENGVFLYKTNKILYIFCCYNEDTLSGKI